MKYPLGVQYLGGTSRWGGTAVSTIVIKVLLNFGTWDMNTKLFVGNLSFKVTESELEELFSQAGAVVSVAIPTDRETGRKRGFAFVEMQTQAEAEAAVKQFNGQTLDGRQIAVNPSQPKENSQRRNNKRW